ncbi:MAG: AAA family ATPase [Sphaerochaetaceae bacterium]|nr:AAA family ATPase [Sphaerochaetaceae bacterium]
MFLKSLEIYGFKSFADRTKIIFADGITALLGPNGTGKSNIVDSIKWVLGEQSNKSLRAGKREDIIFNGNDFRKPMQMAEVTLVIDNSLKLLSVEGDSSSNDIEIKRRLFRNGDTEFYINKERVILKNIKQLFMDTGVGKTAYSILEQGKIDQILSNKPEERRYVFEEAAGISRFKSMTNDAEKKMLGTNENIEQVESILSEIKRTYDSRKGQVTKLLNYKELIQEKENVEVLLQLSTVQTYKKLKEEWQDKKENSINELEEINDKIEDFKLSLAENESSINEYRQKREALNTSVGRTQEIVKGIENQLKLLDKNYWEAKQRISENDNRAQRFKELMDNQEILVSETKNKIEDFIEQIENLENQIIEVQNDIEVSREESNNLSGKIEIYNQEIKVLKENQIELNKLQGELTNEIVVQLENQINESGYSTKVRKQTEKELIMKLVSFKNSIQERTKEIIKMLNIDYSSYSHLMKEFLADIVDNIDDIKGLFQEYSGSIPTFIDEFIKPEGIITRKQELDSKLEKNLSKQKLNDENIETLKENILLINQSIEQKREIASCKQLELTEKRTEKESLQRNLKELTGNLQQKRFDYQEVLTTIENEENKMAETLESINENKSNLEMNKNQIEELILKREEVNLKIQEEVEKYSGRTSNMNELSEKKNFINTQLATQTSNIENLENLINKQYSDFFENYGKNLKEFGEKEIEEDVSVLKERLLQLKKRVSDVGYVNQMAEDEFEDIKTRYDFYNKNLMDLNSAKTDLERVIREIKERSEKLFIETYLKISENFEKMFTRIFGGGKASLSLEDPENVLTSGIVIQAQPPGKKLTYLPSLSGGERSMTAVALLFATYIVKPSPFCILDEIDAALDTRNIGCFLSVLEDFSEKSQFIIISHNKNTVVGAKTLLGVTQQEKGVSTTIGIKIANDNRLPGIQ